MPRKKIKNFEIETLSVLSASGAVDNKLLPKLSKETLLKAYRTMLLARRLDEQALRYQRQGRIGTFAPSMGQEAALVGSAMTLKETDWFVPSFRELGAALIRGLTPKNFILYIMGFEENAKDIRGSRNLPTSIPIATQCAHATGIGWGIKLDKKKDAAIVYFGDGATSEGIFHESMNFASVLKLPVIFFCQNNQWAISTPRHKQTASATLAQKAIAYNMPGIQVDGNDFFAVYLATQEALARARKGKGPTLIEAITFRQSVHTTADDPSVYRTKKEEDAWLKKDPIIRLRKYLEKKKLWDAKKEEKLEEELKAEIKQGYEEAENFRNSQPDPLAFFDYVYEKMPAYLNWQKGLAKKNIEGRNVIKGASAPKKGSGGAAAVGELEEAED